MKIIQLSSLIIIFILILLIIILNFICKKSFSDREKSSPFECGFDPKSSARLPFSLHFFLIAMIFLIFDVELTLILPLIVSLNNSNLFLFCLFTISFLWLLLLGLYHEWNQGALNWMN
uniref:NADH-ubiquinone oxidoreductase chain 3 n=1 Tax=Sphenophorus sp. BYU-CO246 TaxID=696090 RepID=D8WKL7_9CUCU|nr:NADH dehydrogenase subunit 3 [Sphenophorus sp. BYU-CO246]ACZ58550.1 NADH dehydrogenase subunit 3 [Sphenophorus sp. BYU-CO246]